MSYIYRNESAQKQVETWCTNQFNDWSLPHERHILSTTFGDSHIVAAGTGSTSIVFVPGTNFNSAANLAEISHLTPHFRVIGVDVPGQPGLSSAQRPDHSRITLLGQWLDEVIEQLDGPVTVVGHSMGAALTLASRSQKITGRVVFSPGGIIRMRMTPGVLFSTVSWMARTTEQNSRRILSHMCAPEEGPTALQTEWITLVGHTTRSSLAPPKFPAAQLTQLRGTPISIASGQHDSFLPPHLVSQRSSELLGVTTTALTSGHLLDKEALDYIVREVQRINQPNELAINLGTWR